MSTQAKSRILACIVIVMLAILAIATSVNDAEMVEEPAVESEPVTVLIPTDVPVLVTLTVTPKYDISEFDCLRANIYFEAGDQSLKGMEAVALVTLNRTKTKHYPSTVCAVVKEWKYNSRGRKVCQFSWYCDGKPDEPNLNNPLERAAWERASAVAEAAMEGKIEDFLGRATHYHATYVHPAWAKAHRIKFIAQIGEHLFYRDVKLALKSA